MGARPPFKIAASHPATDDRDLPYCHKAVVPIMTAAGIAVPLFKRPLPGYVTDHSQVFYDLPGGKQRENETAAECLARECMEEAGIVIDVGADLTTVPHPYREGQTITYAACRYRSGKLRNGAPEDHLSLHVCVLGDAIGKLGSRVPQEVLDYLESLPDLQRGKRPRHAPILA